MATQLRGQANVIGNGHKRQQIPKHRNLLSAWDGPVPQGDIGNLRGLPAILTPPSRPLKRPS